MSHRGAPEQMVGVIGTDSEPSSPPSRPIPSAEDVAAMRAAFDADFFRKKYTHLFFGQDEIDPLAIYLGEAWTPLDPRADFAEDYYLRQHGDVRVAVAAGVFRCGFHHWVRFGRNEFRAHHPVVANTSGRARSKILLEDHFGADRYRESYMEDQAASFSEALVHFLTVGIHKSVIPIAAHFFDEDFYTAYNEDVREAQRRGDIPSGLYHYLMAGCSEGRAPTNEKRQRMESKFGEAATPVGISRVNSVVAKLQDLQSQSDPRRTPVLNVFIPSLDPDIMFGGYIAFLHLLCRLCEAGFHLRFLVLEDPFCGKEWFLRGIADRPRWQVAFCRQEFANLTNRDTVLQCNAGDACIAYSTWTMYGAWSVARQLSRRKPLFFIQEFEPVFYEHGSVHFLSSAAYNIPHFAIFNSEILKEYFRTNKIGVFANGGKSYVTFEHALADVKPDPRSMRQARRPKRLLCYARPEAHAARNLFEVCVVALRTARRQRVLSDDWEYVGIGSLGTGYEVDIEGQMMKVIAKLPQAQYETMLQSFDVGLSLMWAPHPSVLPFELARAGVVTVTNEFCNRSAKRLAEFGHNIVPSEPSIEGIVRGLATAVERSKDVASRVKAAKLRCPTSWDDVFDSGFVTNLARAAELPA